MSIIDSGYPDGQFEVVPSGLRPDIQHGSSNHEFHDMLPVSLGMLWRER